MAEGGGWGGIKHPSLLYMFIYIRTCTYVYIPQTYSHTHTHTHTHTHACTHTHTTHTHTHTHRERERERDKTCVHGTYNIAEEEVLNDQIHNKEQRSNTGLIVGLHHQIRETAGSEKASEIMYIFTMTVNAIDAIGEEVYNAHACMPAILKNRSVTFVYIKFYYNQ